MTAAAESELAKLPKHEKQTGIFCNANDVLISTHYYKVSQKTARQRIFLRFFVKYNSIPIKIGMHVLEETLNKTVQNMLTSPEICASNTLGNLM